MLELYHHGSSVCAAKVRFVLAEKGLPWHGHYIDILAGGHGWKTFTRQDLVEGREYFEYLTKEVSTAMSKGMTLDEMRKSITLDKYKDWANYDRLRLWNVEAAYYNLKIYK